MTQNAPEWIAVLRADVEATGSVTVTAERVGVSRGALSAILNRTPTSPYVNGACSTAKIEARVMNTIGRILCPFMTEAMGSEHRITGIECRDISSREHAPTSSPRAMAHWRACQSCDKRVAPPPNSVVSAPRMTRPGYYGLGGKADSGEAAYQEGWDCIGGPDDNPYLMEDSRYDYWITGMRQRREFNGTQRKRLNKLYGLEEQQAGIVDNVTLPLPEVGGPLVEAAGVKTGMTNEPKGVAHAAQTETDF